MSELVDYYKDYGPSRFRKRNGEPHKRRALQLFAKRFDMPIIRAGVVALIDPQEADDRLREYAKTSVNPGRRGRPLTKPRR